MVPFRVFDRENKVMWVVLNYHPGTSPNDNGTYLAARGEEDEREGEISILPATDLARFRLVDFLEDDDAYAD